MKIANRGDLPVAALLRRQRPRRPVRYRGGKCIRGHDRPPEARGKRCPECYDLSSSPAHAEIMRYETDTVRHATREFDAPVTAILDAVEESLGLLDVTWTGSGVRTELSPEQWYERGISSWEFDEPERLSDRQIHWRAVAKKRGVDRDQEHFRRVLDKARKRSESVRAAGGLTPAYADSIVTGK